MPPKANNAEKELQRKVDDMVSARFALEAKRTADAAAKLKQQEDKRAAAAETARKKEEDKRAADAATAATARQKAEEKRAADAAAERAQEQEAHTQQEDASDDGAVPFVGINDRIDATPKRPTGIPGSDDVENNAMKKAIYERNMAEKLPLANVRKLDLTSQIDSPEATIQLEQYAYMLTPTAMATIRQVLAEGWVLHGAASALDVTIKKQLLNLIHAHHLTAFVQFAGHNRHLACMFAATRSPAGLAILEIVGIVCTVQHLTQFYALREGASASQTYETFCTTAFQYTAVAQTMYMTDMAAVAAAQTGTNRAVNFLAAAGGGSSISRMHEDGRRGVSRSQAFAHRNDSIGIDFPTFGAGRGGRGGFHDNNMRGRGRGFGNGYNGYNTFAGRGRANGRGRGNNDNDNNNDNNDNNHNGGGGGGGNRGGGNRGAGGRGRGFASQSPVPQAPS